MSTRISNASEAKQIIYNLRQTQENLFQARSQASSGQKAEFYSDLSSHTAEFLNIEQLLSRTQSYMDNNKYVDNRIASYEIAISKMIDIGTQYQVLISELRSTNFQALSNAPTLINNMLNDVVTLLNTQDTDGHYIFAGNRTDMPPVNLSLMIAYPPTGGPADYSYYQGDSTIRTLEVEDQLTINYGILATNTAIEPLLRALREGASMPFNPPLDQLRLGDIMSNTATALSSLPDLFASLGMTRKRIADVNESHEGYKQYLQEMRTPLMDADLAETLTYITQLMTQLEASYAVLSRLLSLSLVNFIR